jgi:hypothetical protein
MGRVNKTGSKKFHERAVLDAQSIPVDPSLIMVARACLEKYEYEPTDDYLPLKRINYPNVGK